MLIHVMAMVKDIVYKIEAVMYVDRRDGDGDGNDGQFYRLAAVVACDRPDRDGDI